MYKKMQPNIVGEHTDPLNFVAEKAGNWKPTWHGHLILGGATVEMIKGVTSGVMAEVVVN